MDKPCFHAIVVRANVISNRDIMKVNDKLLIICGDDRATVRLFSNGFVGEASRETELLGPLKVLRGPGYASTEREDTRLKRDIGRRDTNL